MEAIYIFSFSDWCPTHHQHLHQAVISKIFCNLSKCNSRRTHLQQKCEQYWQSSQFFDCLWSCRNTKNFQNKSKLHGKSFPLTRNGLIRFMRNHSCIFDALHFFSPWHQLLSYSKLDSSGVTVTAQNCSKVQSEFSELMSYWEESEANQQRKNSSQQCPSEFLWTTLATGSPWLQHWNCTTARGQGKVHKCRVKTSNTVTQTVF